MEPGYVRLLQIEPRLGAGLTGQELAEARGLAVAPTATLPAGRWTAREVRRVLGAGATFGWMLAEGLIAHDLELGGRAATHLLGQGDIIAPGIRPSGRIAVSRFFGVAEPTRLAVIDQCLTAIARRWPSIAGALLVQVERQAERVAMQHLISQLPRAEQRIVALFWHLADRWGRAQDDGVVVPLTLGHEAIGHLVGGRRPTVSTALGRLADSNLLVRLANGTWLLSRASRALLDDAPAPSPTPTVRLLGRTRRRLVERSATDVTPMSIPRRESPPRVAPDDRIERGA